MNLNKVALEVLSDCIISKMEQISSIKNVSKQLTVFISEELKILQQLNSKVCEELHNKTKSSNITEQNNSNNLL